MDKDYYFNDYVLSQNDEPIITKNVNSAFIGTDLKERLDSQNINTLAIAGITTNHCVSTTANCGYETYVISDATAVFNMGGINGEKYDAELIHLTSIANLNNEFAWVWDSDKILTEL